MDMPEWMKPAPPRMPSRTAQSLSSVERELEQQTFGIAFEFVLEQLAEGRTFEECCRSYQDPFGRPLSQARFRTWVFRTEARRRAYFGAKAIGAESMEDDLIRIADGFRPDGSPIPGDVQRSKLMVEARLKVMGFNNRNRYGQIKTVEQTTTITTSGAFDPKKYSTSELKKLVLERLGMDGFDPGEQDTPDEPDPSPPLDPVDSIDSAPSLDSMTLDPSPNPAFEGDDD